MPGDRADLVQAQTSPREGKVGCAGWESVHRIAPKERGPSDSGERGLEGKPGRCQSLSVKLTTPGTLAPVQPASSFPRGVGEKTKRPSVLPVQKALLSSVLC